MKSPNPALSEEKVCVVHKQTALCSGLTQFHPDSEHPDMYQFLEGMRPTQALASFLALVKNALFCPNFHLSIFRNPSDLGSSLISEKLFKP